MVLNIKKQKYNFINKFQIQKNMKKKILGGIAVLTIVAVAAFNVNLNTNQKSEMSLLALANVEALAQETGDSEGMPSSQKVTEYIYNENGQLIKTIDYTESCCNSGTFSCTYKRCGS